MIKWVNQLKGVIERVSKGNSDLVNPLIDDNSENLIIAENGVSALPVHSFYNILCH